MARRQEKTQPGLWERVEPTEAAVKRHEYRRRIHEVYSAARAENRQLKDTEIREINAISAALNELPELGVVG